MEPIIEAKLEVMKLVSNKDEEDEDDDDEDDDDGDDQLSGDETSDDENEGFSESLERIDAIEGWLWQTQKSLHWNHVWILEMEFQLVVAYSRLIEDLLCSQSPTSPKLKLRPMRERIVQMTTHLLEVIF